LSEPTDPIQVLLTQVNHALHQLSPPIPQLVWGEGVAQSRQVLQQVRDYLIALQSSQDISFEVQETITSVSSKRVTQQFNHLQREVETLQQERQRLIAEIQQLQIQSQSAILRAQHNPIADYSIASSFGEKPQVAADFVDLAPPTPGASEQTLNHSGEVSAQQPTQRGEDLSDIFGELQFNKIATLDALESPSMTEAESHPVLDHAIDLDASEPPLDGQEYTLASPHESLLPIDEDEDQIDSLLLVGRGTLQRLETELMSLEESLGLQEDFSPQESDPPADQSLEASLSLEQLSTQLEQHLPKSDNPSDATPLTFEALLDPSQENGIPFSGTAHPEAESFSLKSLSHKFSQSSPSQNPQNPRQSEN
jgi:hypothetical protein